ncbi:MFS transporter, DHA1 family, inner membrane transport protein [Frankineae bacterium MT45]|nr:MFS transporter, DHA1 family, inner membrane transport protein [Frankineae bacterium MT45]
MRISPVRRALLSLAVGGFGIGTGEFVIFGLLPNVSHDLSVSIPRAGELISAYAIGVVVGAPLLTIATVRLPRKQLLIGLMGFFALGNFLSSIAPSFDLVLLARFITGLPHGAFFGVGSVVAASLVDVSRRSAAMAVMFTGLTVANVIGVPMTTLLGQHLGWRLIFALVGLIGLIAAACIAVFVPAVGVGDTRSVRSEFRVFKKLQVWLALAIAIFGGGGLFATFSYIAPMMIHVAGFAEGSVTWLLVLFGLGMTAGNLVGARLADRLPMVSIYIAISAEIIISLLFVFTSHNKITAAVTIFMFPATSLAMLPALQNRLINLSAGAPNLAAAAIQAAFNIANSLGAWLGGVAIAAGLGYNSPNVVAAGLCSIGLVIAVTAGRLDRSKPSSEPEISADDDKPCPELVTI